MCFYTILSISIYIITFFFQAEDVIRYTSVTGVQTCALPISGRRGLYRSGVRGSSQRRQERRDVHPPGPGRSPHRSEERRVGKEYKSRTWMKELKINV